MIFEYMEQLDKKDNLNYPSNLPTWFENKKCPKCGLELQPVMGYCCPRVDCPTGLGPVLS